jgi:hypothetical protein
MRACPLKLVPQISRARGLLASFFYVLASQSSR